MEGGLTEAERAKEFITVATGPTSGIYFPIGGAFAMQDSAMQAYEGFGAYEGQEPANDLRALMRLWPNYVQLVTTANTGIKSVEDLKGKRVGVGAANSGLPNATVTELATSYDMVIVPIEGAGRDALIAKYPFYAATTIPADTYNNKEDVESVFVYNIMLVRADLSDAMVYDMLTGIFENISTIQASHNAADKNIYLDVGVSDIQLPLHPGAEKWWADHGFTK